MTKNVTMSLKVTITNSMHPSLKREWPSGSTPKGQPSKKMEVEFERPVATLQGQSLLVHKTILVETGIFRMLCMSFSAIAKKTKGLNYCTHHDYRSLKQWVWNLSLYLGLSKQRWWCGEANKTTTLEGLLPHLQVGATLDMFPRLPHGFGKTFEISAAQFSIPGVYSYPMTDPCMYGRLMLT